MIELNTIYNEDCLDTMARMPNDFIDLTVTSPPYDNLREYKGYSLNFRPIARELFRVTGEGGVVVWVVGDATINGSETGTSFRQALYFIRCGFLLHDTMIYQKSSPPNNTKRYEQNFEYMFVFSKGPPCTFNGIKEPRKYRDDRKQRAFHRNTDGNFTTGNSSDYKTRLRRNVWKYFAGGGANDKFASGHPAVFPEALAQDHIISWSNEGDVVYDPFMGSGTTAKMAILNKRKYLGSEISEEYCTIINKRLDPIKRRIFLL